MRWVFCLFYLSALVMLKSAAVGAATPPTLECALACGDYRAMAVAANRALRAQPEAVKPARRVELLVTLASAYQGLGHYREAREALSEAQTLVAAGLSPVVTGRVLAAVGDLDLTLNHPVAALLALEKGIGLVRPTGDARLLARLLNNAGNANAAVGRPNVAREVYREAVRLADQTGDALLAATAQLNEARLAAHSREPSSAAPLLRRALARLHDLPETRHRAFALVTAARLATAIALPALAWPALVEAAEQAGRLNDDRTLSFAEGYLGQLYEQQARLIEAESLTRQALFHAGQAAAPEALYLWQWQLGRLHKAAGRTDEAIAAYRGAVDTLQSIRLDINFGMRVAPDSFRDLIGPVYYQLADIVLRAAAGTGDSGRRDGYLRQARSTIEVLKTAELQNLFPDQCIAALAGKAASLDSIGQATAVLYPIPLEDRLELLLTLPGGLKQVTVAVPAANLEQVVRRFRLALENTRDPQGWQQPAEQLYHWLVAPLEADLQAQGVTTIVYVPDGALRTIPLAALYDGQRYLVERYAVATSPGLELTDPKPLQRDHSEALTAALTEGGYNFPTLPNVSEEARMVGSMFPGQIMRDDQFTVANLRQALSRQTFSVVHIASHGHFGHDPDDTFLLAHDGIVTMPALEQMIGGGRSRNVPVELLTLSACQTAEGDDRAALGLAGAAVRAGARSVLASLWLVDDAATAALIVAFYRKLHDAKFSKAEALRAAQSRLIADPQSRHPGYWAAFIIIGNWL